ncbi:unnamed protein product [Brassicogethes aeneus]|uniref:DNA ligase 4 n=1 Tax=Brassicogethes aeneus TaxID=1431903 RepID=A0A9P0B4B9_BRAAE|nr:unnamed protein product [Brassicogethes aeneus]
MEFQTLREFFEILKHKRGLPDKIKIATQYMREFRELASTKSHDEAVDFMFNIMRLVVPKLDRHRSTYNIKEARMSKIIIKMLSLPPGNERTKLTRAYQQSGLGEEFSDVVYSVIRKYLMSNKPTLTVHELNKFLDDMTQRDSDSEADEILLKLFKKCTPEDAKWIIKIILRDMKFGMDADRLLKCYHPDGANLYTINNNLRKVCEMLFDPTVKLNEIEVNVFEPFRPMLSKRVDKKTFKKDFENGKEFVLENKFDGERFQLHMENNRFMYFSRNAFNFTNVFGGSFDSGNLTPKIKGCIHEDIHRIILDGELMLYHKYRQEYGSKGMALDVKKLNPDGPYQPCFVIYDIVMVNDTVITSKPLKERLEILENAIVRQIPGVIVLSEHKIVQSQTEIINSLNASMQNEEEGIIIKNPDSEYKCGQRVGGWYKMKMEYFDDVMSDLDLILMGGSHSSTDADKLNTYFLGIKSGDNYVSFAKVAGGINNEQREMLNKKIKEEGMRFQDFNNAVYMFGKEKPQFVIEPDKTMIFVVKATELIRTNEDFKTSYTLRFPRVLSIRTDKPVNECMDMNELIDLCQQNKPVIKLNKRTIDLEEVLTVKPRINSKLLKVVMPTIEDLGEKLDILNNYTVHVVNGTKEASKDSIENIVTHIGGKLRYIVDEKVDIVIVGEPNKKLEEILEKPDKNFDVVYVNWLLRVKENKELLGYNPDEVICIGFNFKNVLCDNVDYTGDGFYEETTLESLAHCLNKVKTVKSDMNLNSHLNDIVGNMFKFKNFNVYFDKYEEINNNNSRNIFDTFLDEMELKYYKGKISETINSSVNLVICYNEERLTNVNNYLSCENYDHVVAKLSSFLYEK